MADTGSESQKKGAEEMCDKINSCDGTEVITNADGAQVTRQCACSAFALRKKMQHPFKSLQELADCYKEAVARGGYDSQTAKGLYDRTFSAEDRELAKYYGIIIPKLEV